MNEKNFTLAEDLINPSYVRLGKNSINKREKIMKELLSQRQLPQQPLDDLTIRYFLDQFALMDSNNFDKKIGVGERESRIFSSLVKERHFYMGHGIGRSGDVVANQPKAAGSSLILQLTRYLVVSALKQLNYEFVSDVIVLPLATGMSISLGLLMLANKSPQKKFVIWSRIDQKTCLKAIQTANLIPVVIQLKQQGDALRTDIDAIRQKIKQIGSKNILAVLSTTSCFAPRIPDDVEEISILAKQFEINHVVNNAYGIWCTKIANKLKQAFRKGQCTIVVQSTDKNFLVPVGGSIIFAKNNEILQKISSHYPGRASGAPILDLFMTLLSMGKQTIKQLRKQRKDNYQFMLTKGKQFAAKHEFKILQTSSNTISIAMNMKTLLKQMQSNELTQLGSILYSKRVMGHRVVVQKQTLTKIGSNSFKNYGSHSEKYQQLPYITFACAVGTKRDEIVQFFNRLEQCIKELKSNVQKEKKKKLICLNKQPKQQQKQKIQISNHFNELQEQQHSVNQTSQQNNSKNQTEILNTPNQSMMEQIISGSFMKQQENSQILKQTQ